MRLGSTLQCFADVIKELEAEGHGVSAISSRTEAGDLSGELSVEVDLLPDSLDVDGVSLTITNVQVEDGVAVADLSVHVAEENDFCSSGPGADARQAYKDPDRLREVYEQYDTFPEMTEALGVDVTAKTVRNYMVEHGIHDPEINKRNGTDEDTRTGTTTDGTGEGEPSGPSRDEEPTPGEADGDDFADVPDEVVLSDGIGLPDGVSLDDVKRSVQSAATLKDVRRELGIEHEQAQELLRGLNLLDLMYGRLVDEPTRAVSNEEIDERIRSAVAGEVA